MRNIEAKLETIDRKRIADVAVNNMVDKCSIFFSNFMKIEIFFLQFNAHYFNDRTFPLIYCPIPI